MRAELWQDFSTFAAGCHRAREAVQRDDYAKQKKKRVKSKPPYSLLRTTLNRASRCCAHRHNASRLPGSSATTARHNLNKHRHVSTRFFIQSHSRLSLRKHPTKTRRDKDRFTPWRFSLVQSDTRVYIGGAAEYPLRYFQGPDCRTAYSPRIAFWLTTGNA